MFLNENFAFAFSLGAIRVNNKFGETFDAEIVVHNDGNKGLKAFIGDEKDYAMLGLRRPEIVNDISLTVLPEFLGADRQIIKLSSKKILFYPSFELVIKAVLENGTVFEKYVLAADFKRSLSISSPPDEGKISKTEEKVEAASNITSISDDISEIKKDYSHSEDNSVLSGRKVEVSKAAGDVYGPVKRGDTLYRIANKIAKRLHIKDYSLHQVVVALWEKNKDKFIHRNMNGLRERAAIDYSDLDLFLSKISRVDAFQVADEQNLLWEELHKDVKDSKRLLISLPYENLPQNEKILKLILQWKGYWEKNDIDGLMKFYSKIFKGDANQNWQRWKEYKKDFNTRFHNIKISVNNLEVLRLKEEGILYAAFLQKFVSDEMNSIGLKILQLKRENDSWKIVKEIWNNSTDRHGNAPYVIHAASVVRLKSAIYEANKWRKMGFPAYYDFYDIPDKGGWYRIFLNRFFYRSMAEKFVDYIKTRGFSNYALIMDMPYALELGTFVSIKDALQMLDKFSKDNTISPFLFIRHHEKSDNNFLYKILVGAYAMPEQARSSSKRLMDKKIGHKIAIQ